jgi:hypothetical protein
MVRKLVSVPPSQRSVTKGMPTPLACCSMAPLACRLVPTNSTSRPSATVRCRNRFASSMPLTVSLMSMMEMPLRVSQM